jgi:C4-dicarboxylate-specific signal transduction histidine kinase
MLSEECQKQSVYIETSFTDTSIIFKGIHTELFHAFSNILENAIQELRGRSGQKLVSISLLQNKKNIFIIIKDNGGGISAEAREHLFDPFFTTKHEGIARGLGLSYSLNAFVSNGGNLEIVDDPEGATFKVTLPRFIRAA